VHCGMNIYCDAQKRIITSSIISKLFGGYHEKKLDHDNIAELGHAVRVAWRGERRRGGKPGMEQVRVSLVSPCDSIQSEKLWVLPGSPKPLDIGSRLLFWPGTTRTISRVAILGILPMSAELRIAVASSPASTP
jgi:hypothetical protein